ncbi:putative G-protein coupled receptor 25 [Huso huso]|uniref:G-protein coupled receptor 25 n=1 Tax=Huso huso TaxID=61971 RepID=A0ABR0YHR0_HUSHU
MENTSEPADHNYSDYYYYNFDFTNVSDLNITEACDASELPSQKYIIPALYFLVFFTGLFGNLLVILILSSKQSSKRRLVDTFVIHLAVADLVFVCTLPLWSVSAAYDHQWNFGNFLCKFSSYVIAVNRYSNIFFLTCMSVDRYVAIVKMLDSRFLRNNRCVQITCGVIWVSSVLLGAPALVYRNVSADEDGKLICSEDSHSTFFSSISLLSLIVAFVLPLAVILFCYCSILAKLRRHRLHQSAKTDLKRRHSIKMVFSIIVAFVISWLPFNVFKSIHIVSNLREVSLTCSLQTALRWGLVISSCLAFFNSCANPILYFRLDNYFRHRAKDMCLVLFSSSHRSTALPMSGATTDSTGSTVSRPRLSSILLTHPK